MDAKSAIRAAQAASGEPAYKTAARLGMTPAAYSSFCSGLAQVDRFAGVIAAIGWKLTISDGEGTVLEITQARDPAATDGRTRRSIEEKKKKARSTPRGR